MSEENKDKDPAPAPAPAPRQSRSKPDRWPWLVGGLLGLNLAMIILTAGPGNRSASLKPSLLIETLILWACSFVPGLRYLALVITIPVTFYTFITKGAVLLEQYASGSGQSQQGKFDPMPLPNQKQGNVLDPFLPDSNRV